MLSTSTACCVVVKSFLQWKKVKLNHQELILCPQLCGQDFLSDYWPSCILLAVLVPGKHQTYHRQLKKTHTIVKCQGSEGWGAGLKVRIFTFALDPGCLQEEKDKQSK